MDQLPALKAVADKTRLQILTLLLAHHDCGRALAAKLGISQAAVSQHLKVLREAGLLTGEKRGYFMHYRVRREKLRELAALFEALAQTGTENHAAGCRCACRGHKKMGPSGGVGG